MKNFLTLSFFFFPSNFLCSLLLFTVGRVLKVFFFFLTFRCVSNHGKMAESYWVEFLSLVYLFIFLNMCNIVLFFIYFFCLWGVNPRVVYFMYYFVNILPVWWPWQCWKFFFLLGFVQNNLFEGGDV